jgi:hypothetical protein
MLSTKVKVECPKCRKEFRAAAKDIRAGSTLTCEFCKTPVRITEAPEHEGIRKALSAARKIRRQAASL